MSLADVEVSCDDHTITSSLWTCNLRSMCGATYLARVWTSIWILCSVVFVNAKVGQLRSTIP